MTFYPAPRPVPTEFRTADLWLRVLTPAVVELDYDALMESRARLRAWSDSSWPADDFTLDENQRDLEEHEREFHAREAFAYTVLSTNGACCEGCVYIRSLAEFLHHRRVAPSALAVGAGDAVVTFWVRDSALARELDRQLLDGLLVWLAAAWQFDACYVLSNARMTRDLSLFAAAGLEHVASLPGRDDPALTWELWRVPPAVA